MSARKSGFFFSRNIWQETVRTRQSKRRAALTGSMSGAAVTAIDAEGDQLLHLLLDALHDISVRC